LTGDAAPNSGHCDQTSSACAGGSPIATGAAPDLTVADTSRARSPFLARVVRPPGKRRPASANAQAASAPPMARPLARVCTSEPHDHDRDQSASRRSPVRNIRDALLVDARARAPIWAHVSELRRAHRRIATVRMSSVAKAIARRAPVGGERRSCGTRHRHARDWAKDAPGARPRAREKSQRPEPNALHPRRRALTANRAQRRIPRQVRRRQHLAPRLAPLRRREAPQIKPLDWQ